eukprot:3940250-Rhodomonas_salina.1
MVRSWWVLKSPPPLSVSPCSKSSLSIVSGLLRAVTCTPHQGQRLRSVCITACDFECESPMSDKILGFPKLILSSFRIHQTFPESQ